MDDIVDVRIGREDLVEGSLIGDIHTVEGGALAGDQLDPIEAFLRGIVQVVNNNNLVAGL